MVLYTLLSVLRSWLILIGLNCLSGYFDWLMIACSDWSMAAASDWLMTASADLNPLFDWLRSGSSDMVVAFDWQEHSRFVVG